MVKWVNWPISGGRAVRWFSLRSSSVKLVNWPISGGSAVRWFLLEFQGDQGRSPSAVRSSLSRRSTGRSPGAAPSIAVLVRSRCGQVGQLADLRGQRSVSWFTAISEVRAEVGQGGQLADLRGERRQLVGAEVKVGQVGQLANLRRELSVNRQPDSISPSRIYAQIQICPSSRAARSMSASSSSRFIGLLLCVRFDDSDVVGGEGVELVDEAVDFGFEGADVGGGIGGFGV